eukprot:3152940-Prymnesium_polylepis.2
MPCCVPRPMQDSNFCPSASLWKHSEKSSDGRVHLLTSSALGTTGRRGIQLRGHSQSSSSSHSPPSRC